MATVRMTQRTFASPDGVKAHWYEDRQIYGPDSNPPMTESLARTLIEGGLAEPIDRPKTDPRPYDAKVVTPNEELAFDASRHTITEVLDMVDAGAVTRREALASERAGKNRKTLLERLT